MLCPIMRTRFHSPLDLDQVCALLSKHLFMGVPFEVSTARDEVPCRGLTATVLGMYVLVYGSNDDEGYSIWIQPVYGPTFDVPPLDRQRANLDDYLRHLLKETGQITPMWHEADDGITPGQMEELKRAAARTEEVVRRLKAEMGTQFGTGTADGQPNSR